MLRGYAIPPARAVQFDTSTNGFPAGASTVQAAIEYAKLPPVRLREVVLLAGTTIPIEAALLFETSSNDIIFYQGEY